MSNAFHGKQTVSQGIHGAVSFEYADSATRLAATGFVATDLYKLAIDLDTEELHILTSVSPISWKPLDGYGEANAVDSVFGRAGAVIALSGDYDSDEITNVSAISGATVSDALETLNGLIGGGSGTVSGPEITTDNAIARWDGTDGYNIQNSGIIIDDSDNITGVLSITADANGTFGGSVTIGGKLTVGGLIDPTGLQFDPQVSSPANNAIWIDVDDGYLYLTDDGYIDKRILTTIDTSSDDIINLSTVSGTNVSDALSAIVDNAGIIDHGLLAGLLDDDHPQYLLVDGTRPMNGDLDMDGYNLQNLEYISFNPLTNGQRPAHTEGILFYDADEYTLGLYSDQADVVLQIGQEMHIRVVNKTGSTITDGSVCYINGVQGKRPTIALAIATSNLTARAIGVATHDILNNQEGFITTAGLVHGFDTSLLIAGLPLYVSDTTPGALQQTPPTGDDKSWVIGIALDQTNNGHILVRTAGPDTIERLFDVTDGAPDIDGYYMRANGTAWTRSDFSADVFTEVDGYYVPVERNLTAGAGLTGGGDLSADRTFDVVANVDGSIVVNANDIQVGILATDAQHGDRGGGNLHDLANASTAGFLSPDGYNIIESHASRHETGGADPIDGYQVDLVYVPTNYTAPINDLIGEHIAAIDDAIASVSDTSQTFGLTNGAILETIDISVTSNGSTVSLSLQKDGGGNLTVQLSEAFYTYTAGSINLTAGSDTSPQLNYIYLEESGGAAVLALSTTSWPVTEHAPVATVFVQSASSAQTDGVFKVHAWTDHIKETNNLGHLAHLNFWIRQQNATWKTGVVPTTTIVTGPAPDDLFFSCTAGTVLQLHTQTFPAFDLQTGSHIYIVNDSVTAYKRVTNLNGELTDSTGASMSGNFFSLVIWGVVSEDTGDCQLMCNLPSGSYGTSAQLIADANSYADFTIPEEFTGTGFLIAELKLQHSSGGGGQFTEIDTVDLRGLFPAVQAGGSGVGGGTEFVDNTFRILDNIDPLKEIAFEASVITSGNTRTITMADADVDLALVNAHASRHETGGADPIDGYQVDLTYVPTNYTAPVNDLIGEHISAIDDALAGFGTGDVTGPGSSTDNAIARYDSTTGKIIQNSGITIDDSDNLSGIGNITLSGTVDGVDVAAHASRHETGGADAIDGYNVDLVYVPTNYTAPTNDLIGEHISAIDDALASGKNNTINLVYNKVGGVTGTVIISPSENGFSTNLGYLIPTNINWELTGVAFSCGSGSASAATSASIRIAEYTLSNSAPFGSPTQYTVGAGSQLTSETILNVVSAQGARFYVNDENSITPIALTGGDMLFVEITTNFWSFTDVQILLQIREV